jgi:hypothetical protein
MKYLVGLLLLIVPWIVFLWSAQSQGATSTFALVITLAASAFGFMILISRPNKHRDQSK